VVNKMTKSNKFPKTGYLPVGQIPGSARN